MPFDSTTYTETKPVFSLEGLIAWLETQPPETEYDYADTSDCLLVRWMRAMGHSDFDFAGSPDHRAGRFTYVACTVPGTRAATYGAALFRARKLLAEQAARGAP